MLSSHTSPMADEHSSLRSFPVSMGTMPAKSLYELFTIVQVRNFGRSMFWTGSNEVKRLSLLLEKLIGNGLPVRSVLTIRVLAQKIQFNTYGGIPLCSVGGLAVVDEKHQTHCTDVGFHLHARLSAKIRNHWRCERPRIHGGSRAGDRQDRDEKQAGNSRWERRIAYGNVFRIKPPTRRDADFLVDALDYSISKL